MAGSLQFFNYTTDDGIGATVFRDKSNGLAQANGGALLEPFANQQGLSSFIKPRYVNTTNKGNPIQKRRFIVGSIATFNAISDGAQITDSNGDTWDVTSKRGEKRRLGTSTDTGLTN